MNKDITFIGAGVGVGGFDRRSVDAPHAFQHSEHLPLLSQNNISYDWQAIIQENIGECRMSSVHNFCLHLAVEAEEAVKNGKPFCIVGGDHSCAVGTWSGVANALRDKGDVGLIWIDAHMDAHTTLTSESGNIHGMPVAALLGHGDPMLTDICYPGAKIKPENICLLGIRSYEPDEKALLDRLGVTVLTNKDVAEMGVEAALRLAHKQVTKNTVGFGYSIDLDGIDPTDAPGTGTPVAEGINGKELCQALSKYSDDENLLGYEIVEFNPYLDINGKTELLMMKLISAISAGVHNYEY